MIFRLLVRDPAVRVAPFMVAAFGMLGAVSASTVLEGGPRTAPPDAQDLLVSMLMVSVWALLNYFAVGKMHEIASPFEMAMPIDARTLWTTRITGMTVSVCGAIVGYGIGFLLIYDAPLQPYHRTLVFNATGFIVLMPFLYHSVRIHSPKWGMPLPVYLSVLGLFLYGSVRAGTDSLLPGLVGFVLAAVLGAATYARLPKCFELPTGAQGPASGAAASALADRVPFDALDGLPLVGRFLASARALRPPAWFTKSQTRLLLTLVLILNLLALSLSPFVIVLVLVLAQFAWFARTINGGARMAHLPFSRTRVFVHATMPGLLAGFLGAVALVAYLPDLTWSAVFADKRVALGAAVYAFAWWFTLSLLLVTMTTPPATAAGWRRRHLTRVRYAFAFAVAALMLVVHLGERVRAGVSAVRFWDMADSRSVFEAVADALPLGAVALWGAAALCGAAAFLLLRREFLNTETIPPTDF